MDDVINSLEALVAKRQRDLGFEDSLAAMYRAAGLPSGAITYETLRRIAKGKQKHIRSDDTTQQLALILRVTEDEVRSADAGYTPVGGWAKYERLTTTEKEAVEGVMDAILSARDQEVSNAGRQSKAEKSDEDEGRNVIPDVDPQELLDILKGLPQDQADDLWRDYDATRKKITDDPSSR